jgi:hypothetical protein
MKSLYLYAAYDASGIPVSALTVKESEARHIASLFDGRVDRLSCVICRQAIVHDSRRRTDTPSSIQMPQVATI